MSFRSEIAVALTMHASLVEDYVYFNMEKDWFSFSDCQDTSIVEDTDVPEF